MHAGKDFCNHIEFFNFAVFGKGWTQLFSFPWQRNIENLNSKRFDSLYFIWCRFLDNDVMRFKFNRIRIWNGYRSANRRDEIFLCIKINTCISDRFVTSIARPCISLVFGVKSSDKFLLLFKIFSWNGFDWCQGSKPRVSANEHKFCIVRIVFFGKFFLIGTITCFLGHVR